MEPEAADWPDWPGETKKAAKTTAAFNSVFGSSDLSIFSLLFALFGLHSLLFPFFSPSFLFLIQMPNFRSQLLPRGILQARLFTVQGVVEHEGAR